jgi:hypothetical protein
MPRSDQGGRLALPIAGIALLFIVVVIMATLFHAGYDLLVAVILAAVLFGISIPALVHQARREQNPAFATFLMLALVLKLVGSMLRYGVSLGIYGGRTDANSYWAQGLTIGPALRHGSLAGVHILGSSGTNFIRFISGVTVAGIGPSLLGGYIFFSWIGFWGLFFFYRAFSIAVPEGRRRLYAYLVFLLPSLIFWPSGVGKEAWMVMGLGLSAFGVARVLRGRTSNGALYTVLGLIACAFVRPHIAAMVALALVVALLVRPSERSLGTLGPVVKVLVLLPVIAVSVLLIIRAQSFIQSQGLTTTKGVAGVLKQTTARTQTGGSKFSPSVLNDPWLAPVATATVLFRPLVYEVKDPQSLVAAFEGSFLILLCLVRFRWIVAAFKLIRKRTYMAFCLTYMVVFVAAYSSIANFGILVRERVQVIPFFLVLLCIPPGIARAPRRRRTSTAREPQPGTPQPSREPAST